MRRPPYPYVRVKWLDAYSEDPWLYIDDYKVHDHEVETSGYLVRETPTYYLIASTVAWSEDELKWEMCASMGIPKSMLIAPMKMLKRPPKGAASPPRKGNI